MDSPILFITFNRPRHVRRVLSAIRDQQPRELFVFQDGAREGIATDQEKYAAVQEVIRELVDWDCNLHTLYADRNCGCGTGSMTGKTRTPILMYFKQCISAFHCRLFSTSKRPRKTAQ